MSGAENGEAVLSGDLVLPRDAPRPLAQTCEGPAPLSKEPALLDNATYSAKILPGFMIPFGSNTALTAFI